MAREAERKASFFGTTKQDRSRRTTYYNDPSPGSSALISYPLSVSATCRRRALCETPLRHAGRAWIEQRLAKKPTSKVIKKAIHFSPEPLEWLPLLWVAKKIFRIAQALCLRVRHGWCPPNGTRGWPAPALKGQYGDRRCQEQYETPSLDGVFPHGPEFRLRALASPLRRLRSAGPRGFFSRRRCYYAEHDLPVFTCGCAGVFGHFCRDPLPTQLTPI